MKEFIKVTGASDGAAMLIPTARIRGVFQEKGYTYIELAKRRFRMGTHGVGVKESVDEIYDQIQDGGIK